MLVWGNNVAGQLALGHTTSQNRPTPVSGAFNNWSGQDFLPYDAIALGGYHFLVLSSQGLLAAAGRGDRGQLGNQSVLDRSSLVPVDIPDVIRPAWLPNSRLSAEVNKAGDLTVRWPAAQDNRAVTGYRIRLRRADGQIQDKDVGLQQVCVFNAINTRQAFEIMVMAYDANSAAAENQTLSRLTGWIRPEGAAADAKREDYFSDWNETVWKLDYAACNWQLDPQGLIRPLDVPWDVSGIYDQPNLPVPADWHGFTGLTWLAGLLLILVLLDFLRRQIKRRGRTGLTPRRIKPGIANLL